VPPRTCSVILKSYSNFNELPERYNFALNVSNVQVVPYFVEIPPIPSIEYIVYPVGDKVVVLVVVVVCWVVVVDGAGTVVVLAFFVVVVVF